jgi:hypothetical protein
MQCVAPALTPVGKAVVASVRITTNGQDFTYRGAQFEYRPVPVITSLHPYRGLEAGGNVVTVSGHNFVDAGDNLICKFGLTEPLNNSKVVGTFISSERVECVAPPGTATPEIQRITLDSGEPEHEVQVVEVSALPPADEVQSVATRAWGWQYEIQQVDVQVNVKSEEQGIQAISTTLKHAREVQSIVVTAASNVSEIQRVIVKADSSLSGTFACDVAPTRQHR